MAKVRKENRLVKKLKKSRFPDSKTFQRSSPLDSSHSQLEVILLDFVSAQYRFRTRIVSQIRVFSILQDFPLLVGGTRLFPAPHEYMEITKRPHHCRISIYISNKDRTHTHTHTHTHARTHARTHDTQARAANPEESHFMTGLPKVHLNRSHYDDSFAQIFVLMAQLTMSLQRMNGGANGGWRSKNLRMEDVAESGQARI